MAQIQQLAGITASNVMLDFTSLSSFDSGNVSLSGGAAVTLSDLQNFNGGCGRFTWTVVGAKQRPESASADEYDTAVLRPRGANRS